MKLPLLILLSIILSANCIAQENLKYCGADELRISTLKMNPEIAKAVIERDKYLEEFTKEFVQEFNARRTSSSVYTIPVVFHVIHNYGSENISDAQIMDGLDILNKTFRKQLADTASIVSVFKPLHADCEIEFRLAKLDPNGNCTSGINRIASHLTSIGDHSVKSLIHWPPNKYMNVYIVENAAGLAGHCVWPSDADTIPGWDGIVIASSYVGSIGTSTYERSVAFAHECGHYLNLQHIWGGNNVPGFYYYPCADPNKDCNIDDLVDDTPPTIGWQSCNLAGASCGNVVDNVQNTMDYSYCNRMFTYGQKTRMQACLNSPIAGRDNLWQPSNLAATGVLNIPDPLCQADFTSNKNVVCQSSLNTITYTNTSFNGPFTSQLWTFSGGTPSTDTSFSPNVTYSTPGVYDVSLKVFNGNDSLETTKRNFVSVLTDSGNPYPFTESFETTTSLNGLEWFSNSIDTINHWQVTGLAASGGSKSVMLNNFDYPESTLDELYSPVINLTGPTTMRLSFKYAYANKDLNSNSRLRLQISNNCNSTWNQRIDLQGIVLETAPLTTSPFIPSSVSEWKQVSTNVPPGFWVSGFRFRFIYNSSGGNNLYIDDINLDFNASTDDLNFSENVFTLYPNPLSSTSTLQFNTQLKNAEVIIYDMLGKEMLKKRMNGDSMEIDRGNLDGGVYFVKVKGVERQWVGKIVVE